MEQEKPPVECAIVKTPCYPNQYKVEYLNYKSDNATWRYKPTRAEALKLCSEHGFIIKEVCDI